MLTWKQSESPDLIKRVLDEARRLIESTSWTPHHDGITPDGHEADPCGTVRLAGYSILGAILAAVGNQQFANRYTGGGDDPLLDAALEAVVDHLGVAARRHAYWPDGMSLQAWNAHPSRTRDGVLLVLEAVADAQGRPNPNAFVHIDSVFPPLPRS